MLVYFIYHCHDATSLWRPCVFLPSLILFGGPRAQSDRHQQAATPSLHTRVTLSSQQGSAVDSGQSTSRFVVCRTYMRLTLLLYRILAAQILAHLAVPATLE